MSVLIAGGGVAGLYAALRILKRDRHAKVIVVERDAHHLGGRVWPVRFAGIDVAGGAGIGRLGKDRRLMRLLRELHVPHSIFKHRVNYAGVDAADLKRAREQMDGWFGRLMDAKRKMGRSGTSAVSFRKFAVSVLGRKDYSRMVSMLGFGDDQEASALDTMERYGMEDNYDLGKGVSIPWRKLVNAMARKIRSYPNAQIKMGVALEQFVGTPNAASRENGARGASSKSSSKSSGKSSSKASRNHRISAAPFTASLRDIRNSTTITISHVSRIILALPAHATLSVLSRSRFHSASDLIHTNVASQSFILSYARFGKRDWERLESKVPYYTVVGGVVQKMVPMKKRGVYMVAYADNGNARNIRALRSCRLLVGMVSRRLGFDTPLRSRSCLFRFIRHGTHYYKPGKWHNRRDFLNELHHALPDRVHVVGEAFSLHQGWVEGALQSVSDAKF